MLARTGSNLDQHSMQTIGGWAVLRDKKKKNQAEEKKKKKTKIEWISRATQDTDRIITAC